MTEVATGPALNRGVLGSLLKSKNAAAEQAEKDYWDILLDPKRNTPEDEAAMASALETLGIDHNQMLQDMRDIQAGHALASTAGTHAAAQAELDAVKENLRKWDSEELPALQKQIEATDRERRNAIGGPQNKVDAAMRALHDLRRHRTNNPRIAAHIPADPAGAPDEIRVRGMWMDPALDSNRQRHV